MSSEIFVSDVNIFPVKESKGKLKAFARIVLNHQFQLTCLRIYEGSKGLFVAYPNDPGAKEEYRQIFFPLSRLLRDSIEKSILAKYHEQALQVAW